MYMLMLISCELQEWHVEKLPLKWDMGLELCGVAVSPWSFPVDGNK